MILLKNSGRADIVTGEAEILHGSGYIDETLLGKRFEIRPKSFFQTNTRGAEQLYGAVRSLIRYQKGILLDLYAGTGTIGILLADLFEKVYSVEIVPDASMDATKNAGINGLSDTFEAVNAPVEQFLEKFLANG